MWWATAAAPPVFVQAGSLKRHGLATALDALAAVPGRAVFRDTFSAFDLADHGFVADTGETWMVRPAGALDPASVAGLVIARAATPDAVALFERTTYANMDDLGSYLPGTVHPPATTLAVAGLHLFVGFHDGDPIATAIAVEGPLATGIQAVTTRLDFRRRGIGSAMVAACCSVSLTLPIAISATPAAVAFYGALGFVDVGPATQWARPT